MRRPRRKLEATDVIILTHHGLAFAAGCAQRVTDATASSRCRVQLCGPRSFYMYLYYVLMVVFVNHVISPCVEKHTVQHSEHIATASHERLRDCVANLAVNPPGPAKRRERNRFIRLPSLFNPCNSIVFVLPYDDARVKSEFYPNTILLPYVNLNTPVHLVNVGHRKPEMSRLYRLERPKRLCNLLDPFTDRKGVLKHHISAVQLSGYRAPSILCVNRLESARLERSLPSQLRIGRCLERHGPARIPEHAPQNTYCRNLHMRAD